ncbi:unnamed protein product [Protopolystoma xenopodis]|uniref:Uncharacterized protein n=1 Tax=Protopolystoma xenopodis TaxID=117903 RepID=A0A448WJZ6_9PLAT|nr:unnamed protein product [Protopolystoma xenopodis]
MVSIVLLGAQLEVRKSSLVERNPAWPSEFHLSVARLPEKQKVLPSNPPKRRDNKFGESEFGCTLATSKTELAEVPTVRTSSWKEAITLIKEKVSTNTHYTRFEATSRLYLRENHKPQPSLYHKANFPTF